MERQSDLGLWIGLILSVGVHVGGGFAWFALGNDASAKINLKAIKAAVLVRKGKPRPKKLLPRIYQKKVATKKRRKVVERRKPSKRKRKRRKVREISDKDLDAIIAKRRRKRDKRADDSPAPGQLNGHKMGTAERARKGSMYAAAVVAKITRHMDFPAVLPKHVIDRCKNTAVIRIFINPNGSLNKSRTSVVTDPGHRLCRNAMLNAIKSAAPFPPVRKLFARGTPLLLKFDG